ncbi:MAG: LysR substrate-binding domain-containing protein [Cognatishimia sp.]|uniref:LysR substrate-binding domain-containing protein n=1 Tax=Cognatishimia sp. TaxID=2211648 RepID=UPI004057FB82
MNNLTLKQLRYFQAVAQEGHFGRAAMACAVTQPALSVQIKDLEDQLGMALFERSTRQVRLTGFGEDFAKRVRDILRSVDELGDLARAAQGGMSGQLRIGVIPTVAPYLLPDVVRILADTYQGVELKIRETLTPRLIDELDAGRLDAAIMALPLAEPTLEEFPLFDEEFVLIRPEGDRDLPVPAADQLREMKLLLLEEGHCFRDQALAFCSMNASGAREMLDASSLSTLVQLVGSGVGVTLIPDMAVPVETRSANVSVARFGGVPPKRSIGLAWRRSSSLAPQLLKMAQAVRAALG